jgi:hypothetical protein
VRRRDALAAITTTATAIAAAARAAADTKPPAPISQSDYLARAALLVDETRRAQDWVGAHAGDVGLASIALEIAEVRSTAAARIAVPVALKQAHMHLLLVLENTTASFDATARGDAKKAAQRMANARSEEQTMLLAFDTAKAKLPPIK